MAIFRAYCICLYGVALWSHFSSCIMVKFKYCYNKCTKKFFGYNKYYSVTAMMLALGLPSFDTVMFIITENPFCMSGVNIATIWWNYFDVWVHLQLYDFFCIILYIFYLFCLSVCLYVFVCLCMGHVAWMPDSNKMMMKWWWWWWWWW